MQTLPELPPMPAVFAQSETSDPTVYIEYRDLKTGASWYVCEASKFGGTAVVLYVYFQADGEGTWQSVNYESMEDLCRANPERIVRENLVPQRLAALLHEEHNRALRIAALV